MKKKSIPVILCLVIALSFAFYGCSGNSLSRIKVEGKQDTSYTVYSNGGNAVQYGNYVYFINGYSGYDDTDGKQNTWPDVIKGALYRAELSGKKGANGEFDIEKNSAAVSDSLEFIGSKVTDYEDNQADLVNVQLIAPKRIGTSGYANGGIFIYDEYVYFASPNNEKNRGGVVQQEKTDFYRVKLDGSRAERIYTTENDSASSPYAFYKYNGAVYLVAQDGTDVISIRIANKIGNKVTIAKNVASVVLPYSETYYKGMNENTLNHFVYVFRAVGDGDSQKTGNVIEVMRPDGKGGCVVKNGDKVTAIEAVRDGVLFYRTADDAGNTLINYTSLHDALMEYDDSYKAYYGKAENAGARIQINGTLLSVPTSNISDYKSFYCMRPNEAENGNIVYYVATRTNDIVVGNNLNAPLVTPYTGSATVLGVHDAYVYFTDEAGIIYRAVWWANEGEVEKISGDSVTAANFNGDYCAGYIVYVGLADSLADSYTMFKNVERYVGSDPLFIGVKTEADSLAAPVVKISDDKLTWTAVDDADAYNIYKVSGNTATLVKKAYTDTSYTLTENGSYYVVAVKTADKLVSEKSDTVTKK